jgi:enoyl-CoA hydratase
VPITRTTADGVALLTLDLGRGNAIDHPFIDALNAALDDVQRDDLVRALVLTGHGRAFCGGLDLLQSADFDRPALERYVDAFDGLFVRVAAFPIPVVAAVNGHAIAGGCILALAADYRIMDPGPYLIGINEVALGIPFPSGAFEISRARIPPQAWTEAFLEGRLYKPEDALRAGLVYALAHAASPIAAAPATAGEPPSPGALLTEALAAARRLAAGGAAAVRATKADLIAPLLAAVEANRPSRRARFLDAWLGDDARARIGRVRDQLLRRKAPAAGPAADDPGAGA